MVASRLGKAMSYLAVNLDWTDHSTWDAIFTNNTSAVYLVVVGLENDYDAVTSFVEKIRSHGTNRVVFLSSSAVDETERSWFSKVHAYLKASGTEWAVLRPSWFQRELSVKALRTRD